MALILGAGSNNISSNTKRPDRAIGSGFNGGLGYAPSKGELETATQVQRLKNQIRRAQEAQEVQERVEAKERKEGMDTKVGMIGKKGEGANDVKGRMLDEKRERRREKKRRQKERKEE